LTIAGSNRGQNISFTDENVNITATNGPDQYGIEINVNGSIYLNGQTVGNTGTFQKLYADNLVYNIGNQIISGEKTFKTRPTVNGTGVLLAGEEGNVVRLIGNQNISGIKNFYSKPTVSGLRVLVEGDVLGSSTGILNIGTGNFQSINVAGTATFNNIDLSEIDNVYISGADLFLDYSGFKYFKITPTGGILSNLSINFGNTNINSGNYTNFIIHQEGNRISSGDYYSSIINGIGNQIATNSGTRNNIYGGFGNIINSGSDNFIIGGGSNRIDGSNSFILGGGLNYSSGISQKLFTHFGYAGGNYSSLIGGTNNSIFGGDQNLILGGNINSIFTSANTGINTIINSWNSIILDLAKANLIIGGAYNQSSGDYSTIINGYNNRNHGRYSNIFNGYNNYITGRYSTILNGLRNTIQADNSTILYGSDNTISQNNGLTIGNKNYIDHSGAVLISDSTSREKYSKDINSLSLDFANGIYLENDVSIYNLRLRNRKYTDYSYRTSNFIFSYYMNIVNSSSPINALLPAVEDTKNFFVKNINSGALNISSINLIDGQSSITLYKNESAEFMGIIQNNYTGWIVIGGNQGVN